MYKSLTVLIVLSGSNSCSIGNMRNYLQMSYSSCKLEGSRNLEWACSASFFLLHFHQYDGAGRENFQWWGREQLKLSMAQVPSILAQLIQAINCFRIKLCMLCVLGEVFSQFLVDQTLICFLGPHPYLIQSSLLAILHPESEDKFFWISESER